MSRTCATPKRNVRAAGGAIHYAFGMTKHLVIGAGPTGSATALLLAEAGDAVTLVSRGGGGPTHPRIARRTADASDADSVTRLADGAATIFNCAMPRYDRWAELFPPINAAAIRAAVASGAGLLTVGNVYAYGAASPFTAASPVAPISEKGRVRAAMWEAALASGARVAEVRGSDYLGRGAASLYTLMLLPQLRAGVPAAIPADLDAAHSWTFTRDVARTLVAAAGNPTAWGRAWHVPSHTASIRAVSERLAVLGGLPAPQVSRMSRAVLDELAAGDSIMHAVIEMLYLLDAPCVLDASATERALGVTATPFDEVLRDTLG